MPISDRLDETTERAARMIGSVMSRWDMDGRPDVAGGIDTLIARALAEAGVLATEPRIEAAGREWIAFPSDQIREEWGVPGGDGTTVWNHYLNREEARIGAGDDPVVHRWVTEWEEA